MALVTVRATAALLDMLATHRVSTSRSGGQRWKAGDILGIDSTARIEAYSHILEGRMMPLALGAFSYGNTPLDWQFSIGRYCSLAFGVEPIKGDHPMKWASTSPFSHQPHELRGVASYLNDVGVKRFTLHGWDAGMEPAVLGHDVWVGMRALLKRGVTIGHGAVIGAGSIVTKDVPPYAIVVGSPARVLRYRFPDKLIKRFLALEWWRFGPDILQPLDVRQPDVFLDRLEEAIHRGATALDLPILTGAELIAAGERVE